MLRAIESVGHLLMIVSGLLLASCLPGGDDGCSTEGCERGVCQMGKCQVIACHSDSECAGGSCIAGECRAKVPTGAGAPCTFDEECPGFAGCIAGKCQLIPCRQDGECHGGFCVTGYCREEEPVCSSVFMQCRADQYCDANGETCVTQPCMSNAECVQRGSGTFCRAGSCYDCMQDSDCGVARFDGVAWAHSYCINNRCSPCRTSADCAFAGQTDKGHFVCTIDYLPNLTWPWCTGCNRYMPCTTGRCENGFCVEK